MLPRIYRRENAKKNPSFSEDVRDSFFISFWIPKNVCLVSKELRVILNKL